jgi:hypothetical protein
MSTLNELASDAYPQTDADWSTERQITAINKFYDAFHEAMGDTPDFDDYCLNATDNEALDEAMRLVEERFGTKDVPVGEVSAPKP